ncbi:MAG: TSUP family transporter [Clostridiales bacterium]|jgi:uncharacterized membrane protein YfcA|nr:TSUP family transporter [Clostridiales bacterium]
MEFLFLLISFAASVIGAICGIGGGVIIKPVIDLTGLAEVGTAHFLSGCTVLTMSVYSVIRGLSDKSAENRIQLNTATPLALSAAVGGAAGNLLFGAIRTGLGNAGLIQSVCFTAVMAATLVFVLKKDGIKPYHLKRWYACVLVGFPLGVFSGFLGLGGGPVNLIALFFFFGMDTKTAAQNSLFIIVFSQLFSLLTTVFTGNIPTFQPLALVLMILGGIGGGVLGRRLGKRFSHRTVDRLLVGVLGVILLIGLTNIILYGKAS